MNEAEKVAKILGITEEQAQLQLRILKNRYPSIVEFRKKIEKLVGENNE